jgi:phosphoribosylaminoimidazole (AIR) synthetase
MGVGMVLVVDSNDVSTVKDVLKELIDVFEIGIISSNIKGVSFK